MHRRLKSIFAVWFIVQIALPFTAPLQMCNLADLLGMTHHHGTPVSPESSTTPTARPGNSIASPLALVALRASAAFADVRQAVLSGPSLLTFGLPPSPPVQQSILRL